MSEASAADEMQAVVQAAGRLFQDIDQAHIMPLFESLAMDLQQALRQSYQGPPTWLTWLAQAHMAMLLVRTDPGKREDAILVARWVLAQVQPVIAECPFDWQVHYAKLRMNLGIVLLIKGRADDAASEFADAADWLARLMQQKTELSHPCMLCWLNQASIWAMQGKPDKAAARFREVQQFAELMMGQLAQAGLEGAILAQAQKAYRAVQIEALFSLGKLNLQQGQPSDALYSMGQAARMCRQQIDEGDLDQRHLLATITGSVGEIYKQFGQLESAFEMYQHAADALEPELARGRLTEVGLLCRVWSDALEASWNSQRFDEAEATIRRALKLLAGLKDRRHELIWAVEPIQRFLKLVTMTKVEPEQVETLAKTFTAFAPSASSDRLLFETL